MVENSLIEKISYINQDKSDALPLLFRDLETQITENRFALYSSLYPFATENLHGYFEYLKKNNLKTESIITVCSSGDQLIDALLFGVHEALCFDINVLSFYYTELKLAALEHFDYNTFKNFFLYFDEKDKYPNRKALNYKDFIKLKTRISPKAQGFFEGVYKIYNKNGLMIRQSPVFRNEMIKNSFFIRNTYYLSNEREYLKAKSSLRNLTSLKMLHSNVKDLGVYLEEMKFPHQSVDIIIFSTIANYAEKMFENGLKDFYDECVVPMTNYLSNNGVFYVAYLFDFALLSKYTNGYRSQANRKKVRTNIFKEGIMDYTEFQFKGVAGGDIDRVCILHRKSS